MSDPLVGRGALRGKSKIRAPPLALAEQTARRQVQHRKGKGSVSKPSGEARRMDGNGASIGNYKGVMLCNRPFAGVSSAAQKAYSSSQGNPPPFRSTCQHKEQLGLNPIRHPPNVVVERSKKDTALSKHRKFLSDLQKQKTELEEEFEREIREKEEKRNRFREKLAAKREQRVRERRGEDYNPRGADPESFYGAASSKASGNQSDASSPLPKPIDNQATEVKSGEPKPVLSKSTRNKELPKWALTKQAVEELEDEEADDLLDFAKALDFDGFLSDLEVRAALKAAKSRVERLKESSREEKVGEEPDGVEERSLGEEKSQGSYAASLSSEMRAFLEVEGGRPSSKANVRDGWKARRRAAADGGWDSSTRVGSEEKSNDADNDDDAQSVASAARSILSTSSVKSLKQIHSARSISKIAEKLQRENLGSSLRLIQEADEGKFEPPRIVSIQEDGGTRLGKKDETYNLPYMHRNPAV
ncbi:Uncharacterized protein SCF082_LOCUS42754 [Durusdinium trenchii]|uniref:Uncharacterized protein n=1 Tax=Durusdinium trenchii TaxID=1381693 RepID=A0ABP0QRS3_9DINO